MKMKKTAALLLALAMLTAAGCASKTVPAAVPTASGTPAAGTYGAEKLKFAGDYEEVYSALLSAQENASKTGGMVMSATSSAMAVSDAAAPAAAAGGVETAAATAESGGYSGTNVQVDGIDEGDIVKTDGKYIYVLRGSELLILKADGAGTAVLSRTSVGYNRSGDTDPGKASDGGYYYENKTPQELYVSDGRAVVVSNYCLNDQHLENSAWVYDNKNYEAVDIYDVSDPAAPRQAASLGQDGYTVGSRLTDGTLYLVTSYYVYNYDESDPRNYVPCVYADGTANTVSADCICICPGFSDTRYIVVSAYDVAAGAMTATQSVLGGGETLYMSPESIYIAGYEQSDVAGAERTESVYTVVDHTYVSTSTICRFDLAGGLTLGATGTVPGVVNDQFSLDEYNGALRCVTTKNSYSYTIYTDSKYGFENYKYNDDGSQTSGLYILDSDMNLVGSVDELAEGEQVQSARFDGDIAYFCTFRNVDPLFAVDVSDPASPKVLSSLKISGFSSYLHPWAEGELLGVGFEADESTGRTGNIKLVMFDTADKADVTEKNSLVTDVTYSEAVYNHRAFLIDHDKNLIGFPADDGYVLYSYDPAAGFTKLSQISFDNWQDGSRGLYIGDTIYVVLTDSVTAIDMSDYQIVGTVSLA